MKKNFKMFNNNFLSVLYYKIIKIIKIIIKMKANMKKKIKTFIQINNTTKNH
jgi:hypothetical protein